MKKRRFTEQPIVGFFKRDVVAGVPWKDLVAESTALAMRLLPLTLKVRGLTSE